MDGRSLRNLRTRYAGAAVAVLVGTGGLLTSCGSSSGTSITLYSGQHVQTTQALVAAFERATGIPVNVRQGDEADLANQIVIEGSHSRADVIFSENSPALEYLQAKGLLAQLGTSTLADTASRYNSTQGDWVGVSARVSVLIYNPGQISSSQLPTTVLQLADPRYKGKLALAPSETDFQPIVTSVERSYGTSAALTWLEAVKSNAGDHIYPNNETVANEVNRGAVAFGVVDQYYWYRMRAEIGASNTHSDIAYFAPLDPGYVLDVSGAAILKSSKNQSAAQRFVAFLVSTQGQQIIAHSTSFEYPIASGVTTAQPETPFSDLRPNGITISELGNGSGAIELLNQAGLL